MKRLERLQMKSLKGGVIAEGLECKTTCYKWNNTSQSMDYGTCKKNSQTVGNVVLESCDCSISGGTDCAKPAMS